MALSPVVDYLLAQRKQDGEPLVLNSGAATFVPNWPAQTASTFYLRPGDGEYAYLLHKVLYDTGNVPQAFNIYAQHYGSRPFDGVTHQIFADMGQDGWLVITQSNILMVRVTNRTNLAQRLSYGFWWLAVKTREDFNLVNEALELYSPSGRGRDKR